MIDKAAWELADTQKMIDAAEALYGPYRWGRYDVLVLPPSFPFGGMENPRLTFATPTILAGDRSLVCLVAHELAHSWSGNLVTNATWNDFWLNEGFTVYLERRIMESVSGRDYSEMLARLGSTIGLKIEIVLGLLFFSLLVYLIEKSWQRALISLLILYVVVFMLGSLPSVVSMIGQIGHTFPSEPLSFIGNSVFGSSSIANNLHSSLQYASAVRLLEIAFNFMMSKILFLIAVTALLTWFYLNYKEKFKALMRNFRAERISAYILMFLFGIFISYRTFGPVDFNWNDWLSS